MLDLAGRTDIPVAAGADRPLERELTVASHVHGDSGLDGPTLPPARHDPLGEHAVDFMERTIAASPQPVTLVPTGPLTNIALLLERTGGANVERIVSMGGAAAEGNMTPAAEFNIWADPEAAQAVYHAGIDMTMIGLDVTHLALTTPAIQDRLRAAGAIGAFVADLVDFFAVYHRETYGWDGAPIHDAVAVAHVIQGGPCDHDRAERRDRARVGALPRTHRRRPLAPNGTARERPRRHRPRRGRVLRPARRADRQARVDGRDVVVYVEVPSGSRNKYELDPELGGIVLDRRLFTSMSYPADYGFIEGTMGEDGDPLDALVLVGEPTFPGCRIRVRVVGVFHMTDEKGPDEKVICVPLKDPAWMRVARHPRHPARVPRRDRALLPGLQGSRGGEDGDPGLRQSRRCGAGDRGGASTRRPSSPRPG